MTKTINVAGRKIGPSHKCFIIAEVAQAHDGSLGAAHAYIDAASAAGVDAIKFQTHIAQAESTLDEPFRVKFSEQDETRFDYWQRMEFSEEQWAGIAAHCEEKGLIFLSSAFSQEAIDLLSRIGMPAWKVGSGEFGSFQLLEHMIKVGGPILLSSGMSSYNDISMMLSFIKDKGADVGLFQCTSKYPVKMCEVGLNVIDEMKSRFSCPVGLSDHSASLFPSLAAMARGADMIEAHITFDRRMFGPDTPASLTVEEFKQLTLARDAYYEMLSNPVDKDRMSEDLSTMRALFGKSIAPKMDLKVGMVLTADMLTLKKPGSGIPASQMDQLIGCRLKNDVVSKRLLSWKDIDV